MGGDVGRVAAGRVVTDAGVEAGGEPAALEVHAERELPLLAHLADGRDPAGGAGEPRIQDDALARPQRGHRRAHPVDRAHDLVPHHLRKRRQRGERAVDALEVDEDLLVVAATDAAEPRLDEHPVGKRHVQVRELGQAER